MPRTPAGSSREGRQAGGRREGPRGAEAEAHAPAILAILAPYVRKRVVEQVKAVWLIVLYLIAFQTLLLDLPIFGATVISFGIVLVVVGLTFFMEGLLLGLMPLGELIGIRLPQKSRLPTILAFAFILGVGATFAEPAVGILKVAGSSVKAGTRRCSSCS